MKTLMKEGKYPFKLDFFVETFGINMFRCVMSTKENTKPLMNQRLRKEKRVGEESRE